MSESFIVEKTINTSYHKVAWNLDLIKNQPERLKNSTVFLGPSLIQGGICDSTLNTSGLKSINMGVNHFGNEMNLYFLERIKHLGVDRVIFHKKKFNYTGLHKLSPLLYTPTKLLKSGQGVNVHFFKYLFKRVTLVLEFLPYSLRNNKEDFSNTEYQTYGVRYEENESFNINQNPKRSRGEIGNLSVNDYLFQSEKGMSKLKLLPKVWYRKAYHFTKEAPFQNSHSQEGFVNTAKEICSENNIDFIQIYMPEVGDIEEEPEYNRFFYTNSESDAEIICLDDFSFLNDSIYWSDHHHLSRRGAILFSKKLIDEKAF